MCCENVEDVGIPTGTECVKESLDQESWILLEGVVPPARFQRATFRLGGGRSMQLSYGSTREQTAYSKQQTAKTSGSVFAVHCLLFA